MAIRGPKRKPTWLKIVNGNPGRRPLNMNEPKPAGELKEAPGWMSASQKEGWDYAIEHSPRGLLRKVDRSALVAWVVAEDTHREAATKVQQFGLLMKSKSGEPMQNMYLCIQNKQALLMLRAAEQLGFTPTSRSRIVLAQEDAPSRFSEFSEG